MRHIRRPMTTTINRNRYPSAPDGRGATAVAPRAKPVGKDPLAVEDGKADTSAQMEYLAAQRRG